MAEDKSDQSSSEESENEGESVAVDSVFNRGDINAPEESDLDSDEEVRKIRPLQVITYRISLNNVRGH